MAKGKSSAMSLAEFDKLYEDNIVDLRALARNTGFRSTGSITLDRLLNGGLPRGTMVELYGPPQSGKSTLATKAGGVCLQENGRVAYVDLERGLDLHNEANWLDEGIINPDAIKNVDPTKAAEHLHKRQSWLRKNGIDPFNPNFRVIDPQDGEQMYEILGKIVVHNLFDLVIVDSMAAVTTRAELAGQPGESHYGQVAKLNSTELKRLLSLYRDNTNTTIIFINQVRDKIGYMQKGQKSTGGHALEHFVGTKVKFTKISRSPVGNDIITESKAKVEKSRYAGAKEVSLFISSERGIDTLTEILDYALDAGYIRKSGNFHALFDRIVSKEEWDAAKKPQEIAGFIQYINGKAATLEFMGANGWQEKLFAEAKKAALGE